VATSLHRRRDARGASAVEFALVAPVLFLVVFGVLQYGLYFFDAHGTRTGVREAARLGVVRTVSACGGETAELGKLKCQTGDLIGAITGPEAVKVYAPAGWERGKPLVVCAMVKSEGAVGLLPMPSDGLITSKTQMSIEVEGATAPSPLTASDTPLSGDWSWC
jgi:Flp pilus assembly protein TadG